MAIELQESFEVAAPIDKVWEFLMTPENVVDCMPGGSLTEKIDDKSFVGSVKLKIGAITAKYSGTITYTTADVETRTVVMLAEAKEKGGGTVTGTITSKLIALDDGNTKVDCESCVDLTGRIVQLGRGMIDGVSAQIIGKFIKNVKSLLEVPGDTATAAPTETTTTEAGETAPETKPQAAPAPKLEDKEDSINVLAILWAAIVAWFKKLFKGG